MLKKQEEKIFLEVRVMKNNENKMLSKAKEVEDYVISFRRNLHENPELSNKEFETSKLIEKELLKMGIEVKKAGNTSIIGILKGKYPGKTVALRADMDALPILEQSGVEFSSKKKGLMHACGHDAHTSMLLGAAKVLSDMKDEISGEVRFIFQEGEENFTGAKLIVADGVMEGVDGILGMHGMPNLKTGYANAQSGYRFAGCDTIYVKFEGVSGHGSSPHLAKDTVHPACQFVTDLQSIVTKNIDPLQHVVLSVGRIQGGTRANVISKYTEIDISMRYYDPEVRKVVHDGIKRHAKAIADAFEIKVDVEIEESTKSLKNDDDMVELADTVLEKILGPGKNTKIPPFMGSEDMSYYFEHAKGVYVNIGYKNEEKGSIYFPHHEKFKLDEDYFKLGVAIYTQFAIDFLNN